MSDQKIDGGYVLQPRKFDESEAAKMPPIARELFQYIVRKVNHKDGKKFKRGQNFFNLGDIQEDLCWFVGYRKMTYSKPQLTKTIRRLHESSMIAKMKATRGLIITVCNYDYYQNPKNYEGNNEGNAKEMRRKREGHTKNKNVKNERNIIKLSKDNSLPKVSGNVKVSSCPHKKIRDLYNSILGSILPFCKSTNATFDKMLKSRWREDKERQNIEWWEGYFKYISESDFLMGKTDNPFTASFEWVIRPTNMSKIINGNYHNNRAHNEETLEDYAKRRGLA